MIEKTVSRNMMRKFLQYFAGVSATLACVALLTYDVNGTGSKVVPLAHAEELNGGQLYHQFCAVCHKSGLNAAPKIGNKVLWIKRVEQGRETVYKNAIDGIGSMPPRGGYSQLSDEEVKAATDYMISRSGGWGDN